MAAGPASGTKVFTHLQERRGGNGEKKKERRRSDTNAPYKKNRLDQRLVEGRREGRREGGRDGEAGRVVGGWVLVCWWEGGGGWAVRGRSGGVGAKANLFTRSLKYKLQEARTFWWTSNSLPSTIIFRSVNSFALRCWLSSFNISVEQEKETDSATRGF